MQRYQLVHDTTPKVLGIAYYRWMEMQLREIRNRSDVEEFVAALYELLPRDPVIGHYFTEVVQINLATHLPKIVDFWEMILFQTNSYQGDPMAAHLRLHSIAPFQQAHFDRWLCHFESAVRERFHGEAAERAIQRAKSIAMVIVLKAEQQGKEK